MNFVLSERQNEPPEPRQPNSNHIRTLQNLSGISLDYVRYNCTSQLLAQLALMISQYTG
jgi:hypothetical protein